MSKILAVDAGWNTGIAFFRHKYDATPSTHCFIVDEELTTKEKKLNYMVKVFQDTLRIFNPDYVLIEGVEFYGSSGKSQASSRRGDLFTLAYLVGNYGCICTLNNIKYRIQTFKEWGGQMTPEVINNKLKRAIGWPGKNQHVNDALAMGLTYNGNKYFSEVR